MNTTQDAVSLPPDDGPVRPRVLVARLGAMNHYLTPLSLARHGMLERFYTDLYLHSRLLRGSVDPGAW